MDKKEKPIIDEIILANNDLAENGCGQRIFDDDEEHCYEGKFGDGIAVLTKDPEDSNAPEKLVLTYPKFSEVKANRKMAVEVRDYAGLDSCSQINRYHIALKYGVPSEPKDIELPF